MVSESVNRTTSDEDLGGINLSFARDLAEYRRRERVRLPQRRDAASFADGLLALLFPQLSGESDCSVNDIAARLTLLQYDLRKLLERLMPASDAATAIHDFCQALPAIHRLLCLDAEAIFAGDPAAESYDEVVSAYPGFLAIAIYRLAHQLHTQRVRLLPRLLSEIAHERTGIDIHPGAVIGDSFCIDHGTGIVIGETTVVGNAVKLYQGVTLGALSVRKSNAGLKRHPTVEDRVVIYANATILGGDTVVGHDSVIGGNVWLPHSVPPFSYVHQSSQVRVRSARDADQPSDYVI